VLLSGCVWLRLLSVRDQFAAFDQHIEVPDGPGVELRFRSPVLLAADLDQLIRGAPTAEAQQGGIAVRVYQFDRLDPDLGQRRAHGGITQLRLIATCDDGKLRALTLPPDIFTIVPRELCLAALRSLGQAQVDTSARTAIAALPQTNELARLRSLVPDRGTIIARFGPPHRTYAVDGRQRLIWRWQLDGKSLRDDGQPVVAAMGFVFPVDAPDSTRPSRFQIHLAGMWLYLDL
jgi:hypothetical protein